MTTVLLTQAPSAEDRGLYWHTVEVLGITPEIGADYWDVQGETNVTFGPDGSFEVDPPADGSFTFRLYDDSAGTFTQLVTYNYTDEGLPVPISVPVGAAVETSSGNSITPLFPVFVSVDGAITAETAQDFIVRDGSISLGSQQRTLLISDFPATYIPTASDVQPILVRLKKLVRRSRPAVARQIENYVYSTWEALNVDSITGEAPDATNPTNMNLKITYGIFADYLRVERIKVKRLLDVSANTEVRTAMAQQFQFWLETQGWYFTEV